MNLLTVSFASDLNHAGLRYLQNSLNKFGYTHKVIEADKNCWDADNTARIAKWLKQNRANYTHLLCTDAFDTLALGPQAELLEKYHHYNDIWLYSAEKNCYPRADWKDKFAPILGEWPRVFAWTFLNAGQWIAPIDLFIRIVESFEREAGINDQEWGSKNFLFNNKSLNREFNGRNQYEIMIDTNCEIFQSMYMEDAGDFAWTRNGRLLNRVTNTLPTFVHGNGQVDIGWLYNPIESPFYK